MKSMFRFLLTALATVIVLTAPAVSHAAPEAAKKAAVQKPKKLDVSKIKFKITTDKSPVSYKAGEKMTFTISLDYGQELPEPMDFFVRWTRTGDDGIAEVGMSPITPEKAVVLTTSLDRPGFVRVTGELVDMNGKQFVYFLHGETRVVLSFDGGAGADVDKILPACDEPADFEVYWTKMHAELNKVPVKVLEMKEIADSNKPKEFAGKIKVFAVKVTCAGPRPVTGFLLYPANAKAKSLPAQVSFDGYGEGGCGSLPSTWEYKVAQDRILFHINAHGYDLRQDDAYYKAFFAKIPDYAMKYEENQKPETSYFRGMAFRVIRAFDFVKTLPQWNGKDLTAQGGSQGGLQTAWAGSQVKGLTLCKPHVTWCSDLGGVTIGRIPGWRPSYTSALNYYDTVFHARHIPATCKLFISRAGLGDYTCPPSGLAAQYNSANCPKAISWMQNSTHMYVPPEPQTYISEAPAGKGLKGKAPAPKVRRFLEATFVKAKLSDWTMTVNGKSMVIGDLSKTKQIRLKMGPDGKDLPVMTKATLSATITAEADGYVLLGAGVDWWWECYEKATSLFGSTELKPIFGRHPAIGGGNGSSNFDINDWVFRFPVKKGVNDVRFEIVLGEQGKAAIGLHPQADAAKEIGMDKMTEYRYYRNNFPEPFKAFKAEKLLLRNKYTFETSQPYPAGIEYRVKGEKDWKVVWDKNFTNAHAVPLPLDEFKGKEIELRTVCHAYFSGWNVFRSEVKTVKF